MQLSRSPVSLRFKEEDDRKNNCRPLSYNAWRLIMPIYAYKCTSCGFEKDFLQKMSDKPLTKCPKCGKDTLRKELSAPGFELKGSGWAATDFNSGPKAVPAAHVHSDK